MYYFENPITLTTTLTRTEVIARGVTVGVPQIRNVNLPTLVTRTVYRTNFKNVAVPTLITDTTTIIALDTTYNPVTVTTTQDVTTFVNVPSIVTNVVAAKAPVTDFVTQTLFTTVTLTSTTVNFVTQTRSQPSIVTQTVCGGQGVLSGGAVLGGAAPLPPVLNNYLPPVKRSLFNDKDSSQTFASLLASKSPFTNIRQARITKHHTPHIKFENKS